MWTHIAIHHSLSGKDTDIDDVYQWHVNERGWQDVGYHFVIPADGKLQEGRKLSMDGAHTRGWNDKAIGICLMGNFNKKRPTDHQLDTLERLVDGLMKIYDIPVKNIKGHRDLDNRTCPGDNFSVENFKERFTLLNRIKKYIKKKVG